MTTTHANCSRITMTIVEAAAKEQGNPNPDYAMLGHRVRAIADLLIAEATAGHCCSVTARERTHRVETTTEEDAHHA